MMIPAPLPMKPEFPDAYPKADPLPSLMRALDVTRAQFSDVLRYGKAGRF